MAATISYWTSALLASFLILQAYSQSADVIKEKTRIFDTCRKQDGSVTESQTQGYFDMMSVKDLADHKCFVQCVVKEYDVITPDNELDLNKVAKVAAVMWPRPKELSALPDIADSCAKDTKKNPDACTYIFDQSDCYFTRLAEKRDAGAF